MTSALQQSVVDLVKELFPHAKVKQEYPLGHKLHLDILIKFPGNVRFGIEVQGKQHYVPNSFFFNSPEKWLSQQHNDELKQELCREQNIVLLYYDYNEKVESTLLLEKIKQALEEFEQVPIVEDVRKHSYKEKQKAFREALKTRRKNDRAKKD